MKMRKLVAALLAVLLLCSIIPFSAMAEGNSATIDFGDKANRVSYSTSQQVWAQNGITVTNDKAASTSNVGDYGGEGYPVRFYKSSAVTVEYLGMTQIVFNCDDYKATYATDLAASITDGSVSVDGTVVTVTLATPADTFVIAELAAQVRVDSITVYGEGGGSVVPPVDPEEPPVDPEDPEEPPVDPEEPDVPAEPTGSATIDFGDKANRVSYSTSQQVWAQNGITVTNDKGASTSNVGDYGGEGYPVRFYKSSTVTVDYKGMTQIVFNCDDYKDTYATDLAASITDGSVSVDGTVVTVTLAAPADTFVIAELAAQVRVDSITVYGEGGGSVTPPVEPDEPDVPVTPDEPDEPVVPADSAVLDLTDKANRVSYSSSQQVWKQNGIIVTNDKGASTSNVGDYGNPGRFYKSSTVTIEYPGMTKIVIDSVTYDDNDYAIGWTDSFTADATATVVDGDVTIVLAEPADVFVWEKLTSQSRAYTITVYTGDAGETPDVPDVPEVPSDDPEPDTELTIAEAIALGASKEHNVYTAGWYYVTGVITEVYNTQWGNMYITDGEGNTLTIYGSYSADGEQRYDAMDVKPVAGDTVTIYGMVGQYNGNPQIKNGWIVAHIPGEGGGETPVDPPVEPPVSDEIETDYPFLFGMTQYNVSEEDVYFLNGEMNGFYMDTTTNPDEAIVVYVEATEGGYYFYTYDVEDNKVYINMVVSEDGKHVNGAYEYTASTVYRYDAEYGTLIAEVNGADYWFGTRNDKNYTTVGPCKVEYEGFYCEFYYFEEEPPVEPCEHEYDNACDDECNLCGELREVGDHVYDDEYDADCNECGATREVPEEPVYVGGIAASTNTGAVGENVNVQIQVDNNPGIVSVKVKVHFDNTVLKLVSYEAGNFSAGGYSWGDVAAANEKGYFIVNWCDATQPNSTAQMLATLTFEVLESAQVGEMYDIVPEFDCVNDIFNAADDTVWFYAVNGGVTIVDKTAAAGDANGDGKVNNKDLALLQQYLADWDVAIDEDVVDVNNDGKVNNKDLALLQQYLADWDVELA